LSIFLKSLPGIDSSPNHQVHGDLGWDAYICVSNVEAVYEDLKRRGAKILREMEDARTVSEISKYKIWMAILFALASIGKASASSLSRISKPTSFQLPAEKETPRS
jgi:hypothetical protein